MPTLIEMLEDMASNEVFVAAHPETAKCARAAAVRLREEMVRPTSDPGNLILAALQRVNGGPL